MASKSQHAQSQKPRAESILLRKGPFDANDELEGNLFESFTSLQMQLKPPYQLHSHSEADLVQLNQALLYGILTQQQSQQSYIMHLAAVTRDGYARFVSILSRLVDESYPKLLDPPRQHLLWVVRQLISLAAAGVDTLCLSLLRRIVGGDISHGNIWVAGQMLDVLQNNWSWLVEHSALLTGALFTFLRLLPDHFMSKSPIVTELRRNEVAFCVKILRNCFQDCLVIGRDLVRLLQDVACIPEFEPIWKDLLSNTAAFNAAGFADIAQLYVVRTPTRYLTSRLTPEMEAQIRFMLTHVRMGSQIRYQAWFSQRFLASPGSDTLVCDLIRFVCCVHHPTNQILQSDIVPRWVILGWLLKCCKSHHVEANAKLALFFDWLFFLRKTDNIMNIEPALLLMVYSVPKYSDITQSLLEFLFLCMEHYDPQRKDLIWCGVTASVDILVEKGVVQSLKPLSSSPHIALSLRRKLNECFPTYCHEPFSEAKGELSPKGIPKIGSVTVLEAQTPVSKQIEAPAIAEVERDVGAQSFNSQDDGLGSLTGKIRSVDPEDAGSCKGHEKVIEPHLEAARNPSDDLLAVVSRKKRRIDVVTLDDLSKALQSLPDDAVDVFERLLMFHLSNLEALDAERNLKETPNCGAEKYEMLAKSISSIMKGSKSGFFAPLHGHSLDPPEKDELASVTSIILRLYTWSTHPRLLHMLLCWHAEGYAVGARLLCYSCRLAEDIVPSNASAILDWRAEGAIQSPQKHEKKQLETLSAGKGRNLPTLSALSWHLESSDNANQDLGGCQKALEPVVPAHAHSAGAVCFMAYKEFLKGLKNKGELIFEESPQLVSVSGKHERNLTEGQVIHELEPWFVKDLETCLAWSIPRLYRILPFVFNYLSDLSRGNEQVIKLLVSTVDPVELSKLELRLSLKETSVFGASLACIQTVVKNSLVWDCFEQQYLWRLLIAEWQNPTSLSLSDFVNSCALFLRPEQHCEALSGLLSLLRRHYPTMHLVSDLLLLPQGFNRLVAAVLAAWTSIDSSRFLECLTASMAKILRKKIESSKEFGQHLPLTNSSLGSALSIYLSFLDRNYGNEQTEELRRMKNTLLKLAEQSNSKPVTNAPAISEVK